MNDLKYFKEGNHWRVSVPWTFSPGQANRKHFKTEQEAKETIGAFEARNQKQILNAWRRLAEVIELSKEEKKELFNLCLIHLHKNKKFAGLISALATKQSILIIPKNETD